MGEVPLDTRVSLIACETPPCQTVGNTAVKAATLTLNPEP